MVARHPAALPALFASHQTPITLFSRFSSPGNLSIRSRLHHKCLAFDVIMTTILVRLGIFTSEFSNLTLGVNVIVILILMLIAVSGPTEHCPILIRFPFVRSSVRPSQA